MADANRVNRYVPKNSGMIQAVMWTGKAECLIGFSDLNNVVSAIQGIDSKGLMHIICTGDEDHTVVRPYKDYVGIDSFGNIAVWQQEFMKQQYDIVPDKPVSREETDPYNRLRRETITVISADRPDGT